MLVADRIAPEYASDAVARCPPTWLKHGEITDWRQLRSPSADNKTMHAKPDVRVFLKWMITRSSSVILDVIQLKCMSDSGQHERLIDSGLALHEARDYSSALPVFQQALLETPECVSAQYNVANTLHMLGRDGEATSILANLLATNDEIFIDGCPLGEDPAPFKLDALYLIFLTTLYDTGSWNDAYPYALKHLHVRNGDVESEFSDPDVNEEIKSLKAEHEHAE